MLARPLKVEKSCPYPSGLLSASVKIRPYANSEAAARKLVELATGVAPVQDGRIHIENQRTFLFALKATGSEFGACLEFAVERGWLELDESGTYVRILPPGIDLFPRQ